jgi:hypothetical protein
MEALMSRKLALLLALGILVTAVPARAQTNQKLAFLIPNLYGPDGLKVNSLALVTNPDGSQSNHSGHFNSAFQTEFTQFNISLASQLSAIPIPSPASGFTFSLDSSLGVMKRSTQSFGPIYAERAETIGKKTFSVGISYQHFTFDTIEGQSLGSIPAVFTHDSPAAGGRADVIQTANGIDLSVDQTTLFVTYGILDRLDLSLAVPYLNVDMGVTSLATIQRIGTGANTAVHFFADPAAPKGQGDQKTFSNSNSASGIGDLLMRLKGTVLKSGHTGLALGADFRFPTGDEENFLGSGAAAVKPFLAWSLAAGKVSPHVNLGYLWTGDSVLAGDVLTGTKVSLPDEFIWAAGFDVGVVERLTLAADVLGRHVSSSPQLQTRTFTALDGQTTFPDIHFVDGSFDVIDGAFGLKFNAGGKLLIDLNVLVKLNNSGLRDKVTPLLGLEYSF